MSELVEFDPRQGVISVVIDIKTPLPWSYTYTEANGPVTYSAKSETQNGPHRYALGFPQQMNSDTNSFVLTVVNPSKEAADYALTVEWVQEGSPGSKPLHSFKKTGTVGAKSHASVLASTVFMEGET